MMKTLWEMLVPGNKFTVLVSLACWVLHIVHGNFGWAGYFFALWFLNTYSYEMQRRGYHA